MLYRRLVGADDCLRGGVGQVGDVALPPLTHDALVPCGL